MPRDPKGCPVLTVPAAALTLLGEKPAGHLMLTLGNMPRHKRALHALNRIAFGPRPGDLERVNQIGVERYMREQLDAETIPVPQDLARRVNALRTLQMTPAELFINFQ